MYAVSGLYLDALRGAHTAWGHLEAWRDGTRLTLPDGGTELPLDEGGQNQVAVDGDTPGPRRTLSATLARTPGLFDALAPIGTEIRAYTTIRYPSGVTETVPQGVFVVDVEQVDYAPGGTLQITAPDRWVRVQNARFLTPRSSIGGGVTVSQQIANLIMQALPAGSTAVNQLATSTAPVPAQTWDQDRADAVQKLAKAASLDVFFDRTGIATVRAVPVLNPAGAVWTVDASPTGVLMSANRQRDRQKTYNLVVVQHSPSDGSVPLPPQFVWDNDPTSPTYAGPDPVNHPELAGPFGVRPTFFPSPLFGDTGQMQAAGLTVLARVQGLAAQLTLTEVPNPALDDGDTITTLLPRDDWQSPQPFEVHIVDALTVPLVPSKNAQTVTTRSTRPDDVAA